MECALYKASIKVLLISKLNQIFVSPILLICYLLNLRLSYLRKLQIWFIHFVWQVIYHCTIWTTDYSNPYYRNSQTQSVVPSYHKACSSHPI